MTRFGLQTSSFELFGTLVRRELANRYKGAILGPFWPLISQLCQLFVFTYVFSYILKVRLTLPGVPETNFTFGAWLFAGLMPWTALVSGVIQGASSVVNNQNIVKKVVFPLVLLPLVPVVASFIESSVGLPIVFIFDAVYFHAVHPQMALIVIVWVAQLLLTGGGALIASAATVFVRDVPLALNSFFLLAFYLTPIVYPETIVPPALAIAVQLNPMAGIVASYRDLLITGNIAHAPAFGISLAISAALFAAGVVIFTTLAPRYADEL